MEEHHILTSFDKDIRRLEKLLLKMNECVLAQSKLMMEAYINFDKDKALEVIKADHKINLLDFDVDKRALRILLRHQPMAKDLRFVFSAPKITNNLERIADGSKFIANAILEQENKPKFGIATLENMMNITLKMQEDAIEAWKEGDETKAVMVREMDNKVDELYSSLCRELITWMSEDTKNISPCLFTQMSARYIERAGDHVKNICESVYFVATGIKLERIEEESAERYSFESIMHDDDDDDDEE